jgi:hypothetical protein
MATILSGSTKQSLFFDIQDTTGAPLTGLAYDTAGLVAYYAVNLHTPESIPLIPLTDNTDVWQEGGFIELDAVNLPGVYRLDVPNVFVFQDVDRRTSAVFTLSGATNMRRETRIVELLNLEDVFLPPLRLTFEQAIRGLDIDGTWTFIDYLTFIAAATMGKLSGADGTTLTFRDVLDSYDVLRAILDGNGNRVSVTVYP